MLCRCVCVQMNWCEESLSHAATGWDAAVKSRTIYDHSDVAPHNRMPNQSERTALWTRHRLDMPNTAPDAAACKESEAFPVLSGVVICVGLPTDVHYSLSEIPPAGEESPPLAMNVAGQAAALHAGLGVRTTANPLRLFGIAWLRASVCKLRIVREMLEAHGAMRDRGRRHRSRRTRLPTPRRVPSRPSSRTSPRPSTRSPSTSARVRRTIIAGIWAAFFQECQ